MASQSVHHITGPHCGTHTEGAQLYRAIEPLLNNHEHVELHFDQITVASSSFFNGLFRPIIQDYGKDVLAHQISFEGLTRTQTFILQRTQRLWLSQT